MEKKRDTTYETNALENPKAMLFGYNSNILISDVRSLIAINIFDVIEEEVAFFS